MVAVTDKEAEKGEQELEFMFDTNYECMITVYLCATECRNASATPLLQVKAILITLFCSSFYTNV